MIVHRKIRKQLGEFALGNLDRIAMEKIEHHLLSCSSCRDAYEQVERVVHLLREASVQPSTELSADYWSTFADRVEERVSAPASTKISWTDTLIDALGTVTRLRWRTAIGIAGGFAALAVAFILFQKDLGTRPSPAPTPAVTASQSDDAFNQKVSRYFGRSQTLLVGLSNSTPPAGAPVTTEAEQGLSRQLAEEARVLKHQPLDQRSAQLVGDLEKIFIELANADRSHQEQRLNLIRGGIRQENLLFKVRMARARFDVRDNRRGTP